MPDSAGTEGQVGHHDDHTAGGARRPQSGRRGGERTGGRGHRLAVDRLAAGRGRRRALAATHLHGDTGRGPQEGPQFAEADAPVPRERVGERAPGRGGQRRPFDGGRRREDRTAGLPEGRSGRLGAAPVGPMDARARQTGVHTEGQWETAPARDSGDPGQSPAGCCPGRAGTGVGSAVRAEVLRLPPGPRLPRRDRGDLLRGSGPQPAPPVDPRRRSGGGVRPDRPQPPPRRARHLPRQGQDRRVAASGRGRTRTAHTDHGGNSARRGDQPVAVERGPARDGGSSRSPVLPRQRQALGEIGAGNPDRGEVRR